MDEQLIAKLVEHERIRQFAYTDTKGFVTVGIGRCLDSKRGKGLSIDECFYLLNNDIKDFKKELSKFDWFEKTNEVRQGVLIEMAFNLGVTGLLGFKKTIEYLENFQYAGAAKEMANSRWANQIGTKRLKDLQNRMNTGRY